jgi:hypothetical protein
MSIFRKHGTGRREYTQQLEALRQEISCSEEPHPTASNGRLPLVDLATVGAVFQPREAAGNMDGNEWFIDDLKQAVERNSSPDLDPILVWWSGRRWIVIDGHHRLEAYQRASREVQAVPVEVFSGNLDDARLEAVRRNHKNKLIMRQGERLEAAWRLVCTSDLSKARIAECCGVAARTVAKMRSRGREVIAAKPGLWSWTRLAGERWALVKSPVFLSAEDDNDFDPDAAVMQRAKGYAAKLVKNFGRKPMKDPDGFALALALFNECLPKRLMESEHWTDYLLDHDPSEDMEWDF